MTGAEEVPDGRVLWSRQGGVAGPRGAVRSPGHEGADVLRQEGRSGADQTPAVRAHTSRLEGTEQKGEAPLDRQEQGKKVRRP